MTTAVQETLTGAETPAESAIVGDEQPVHYARCSECPAAVRYRGTASGGGMFWLEKIGVDDETHFGISDASLPLCPFGHGEMALADESIPAHEAITDAADRLNEATQAALPGVFPAFNYEGAYLELEGQAERVARLKETAKEDAETARESKKAWEKAAELLTTMALEFERRRREKSSPVEPEPPAEQGTLVPCLFEQKNPQVPCPLCDGSTLSLDPAEIKPHDSEGHVEQAEQMLARRAAADLMEALEDAGLIIDGALIATWSEDQRQQVETWLLTRSDIRPPVLGTGHLVAEVEEGASVQACHECGAVLLQLTEGDEPYKPGTLVGTDCEGAGQSYPKREKKAKKGAR